MEKIRARRVIDFETKTTKEEQIFGLLQERWTGILHLLEETNHECELNFMYTVEIDEGNFIVIAAHDDMGLKKRMV